jgi:NADH-quinone oxidoreductase subunit G
VRAGWKVLRALGGTLRLPGFEFDDLAGLREGIAERASVPSQTGLRPLPGAAEEGTLARFATWPIYRTDAVLRRAAALNAHPLNRAPAVRLNPNEAMRHGFTEGAPARIGDARLPVAIDSSVPDGAVWIEATHDLTATLPPYGAAITLSKA